jgi:DNA-binding transcriptional LysR family regulator
VRRELEAGIELRQIRYLIAVAEELHFGRAADRQHIVQSALSQQVQRLERELGVRLVDRSTHHVKLTAAGAAFVLEARKALAQVNRASDVARAVAGSCAEVRVGVLDASYDSMPRILGQVQAIDPALVIHQVEFGEADEYQMLADGRLDIGVARPALGPEGVASYLFRRDQLGILAPAGHRFTGADRVPVASLAGETLLFVEETRVPSFNQFVGEMCRAAGFTPSVYAGTVASIRAAGDLVAQGRCLCCVPVSSTGALPGTIWRPLTDPASYFPWSIIWRSGDVSVQVRSVIAATRTISRQQHWLHPTGDAHGAELGGSVRPLRPQLSAACDRTPVIHQRGGTRDSP